MTDALPYASVVLPTLFARGHLLDSAVKALCDLDYPRFEVLVVDNRPAGTRDERDWPGSPVRVIAAPRPGTSAARNAGILAAQGEFVAFVDDDVEVDPGWLGAIARAFARDPGVDCVTGTVLAKELETPAQRYFQEHWFGKERRATTYRAERQRVYDADDRYVGWLYQLGPFGTGANMAFRTRALRSLGGFDEALGPGTPSRAGEDIALFARLLASGRRLAVEPGAIVYHTHRRTFDELREQLHGYGSGLTAVLTALALENPGHLLGYARMALDRGRPPGPPAPPDPAGLARARRCGLRHGPLDYLRGRLRMRR